MVFTCSFCRLIPGEKGRREGGGKLTLSDDNIAGVIMLLKQQWPQHAECADLLEAGKGATVCFQCMPEEQRTNITRVVNGRKSAGTLLVGQPAARWTASKAMEGIIVDIADGGLLNGYVVKWTSENGEPMETLSLLEAEDVCAHGLWIKAQRSEAGEQILRRKAKTAWDAAKRAKKKEEAAREVEAEQGIDSSSDDSSDSGEGASGTDEAWWSELSEEETKWLKRSLTRSNLFDDQWWAARGYMGAKLHTHLFGFETPGQMRHFFKVAFRKYRNDPKCYGLDASKLMGLALLKMKTGKPWLELEAEMGALAGKGWLTRRVTEWIHRLGAFSKASLIGVVEAEYMDECIPKIYRECEMADSFAIGDGTVFLTETPRRGIFKALKNQLWNDKTHHSGALGESLCSPHGLNMMAADLFTGRTSEVNALKELIEQFKLVPAHKSFTYDKGAKALRCLLPNGNHLYMPCFLAPSQGKTTFTGEEASANKAIARCRYVIEITYTRVKDWKLLAGEIPRENFHLICGPLLVRSRSFGCVPTAAIKDEDEGA